MTKITVTSALPYANGPIHIGHLIEYIQTDVFVRFLKLIGKDAVYICAEDAHGTPIEINAKKEGTTPEKFIAKWFKEHQDDFKGFHINFDNYYTTNSKENKQYADLIFKKLKEKKHIYEKEIELNYCNKCKRFLPDRYIKGKCPKCNEKDQYGDVCEKCHATYSTTDLIEPYCVICSSKPTRKKSKHYFFKLSVFADKLRKFLTEKKLQKEIVNHVLKWVDELEDWDITRDAPYFGFKIPGEKDKYYYVWLDAPIGYISSTKNYCDKNKLKIDDYWKNGKIIHFIGKDIIYFHFLFWPAMLMDTEFSLPDDIVVHGFLTVNNEKMSKSRGTYFTAKEFLKKFNPEFLRYYYASNLTHKMQDINLDFNDFKQKINNELISNIVNFIYRSLSFTNKFFDSKITDKVDDLKINYDKVKENYENYEFREAVKEILNISSKGNKYFQDNQPWDLVKDNKKKCQIVINTAFNLVKDLIILLKPILPDFCEKTEKQLKLKLKYKDLGKQIKNKKIGKAEIIFKKITEDEIKRATSEITVEEDPLSKLNIKVAKIINVKDHPEAERLYIIDIDLGEKKKIVASIKDDYTKKDLKGKNLCILTNLKPAKFKGVISKGMLLAGEADKKVRLVLAPKSAPGDQVYIEGIKPKQEIITFNEFKKVKMFSKDKKVIYKDKFLKTDKEDVVIDIKDGILIH